MKDNFLFYGGRKKVGNLVVYKVKGKTVTREYVRTIANPRTPKQTMQRAKFAFLVELAQGLRPIIRAGFEYMANVRKSTTFNAFFNANYRQLEGSTPETVNLTPENMILSKGPLSNARFSDTIDASSVPNQVTITITDSGVIDPAESTTKVVGVVFCEETNEAVMSQPQARLAGGIDINVPQAWAGLEVHCYGFTITDDGKKTSDSFYIGHVTIS